MVNWICSDHHWGHAKIIGYCNRPFSSVEDMDEAMINNWNNVVGKNDTVYHLGDIFLTSIEREEYVSSLLNGYKVLIRGNHDKRSISRYASLGFLTLPNLDLAPILGKNIILSHKPMSKVPDGYINYHGHIHNSESTLDKSKYKCFSVELTNYYPVRL